MAKIKKTIAVIPARGGSKSIPRKNLVPVNGKPLIAYTIEAALKARHISKVVVSSEDEEILTVAEKYGAELINRPPELATDTAMPEQVVYHAIKELERQGEIFDVLALLQPIAPLRDHDDLDQAFDLFYAKDATALISVYEPLHTPYKTFKLSKKGFIVGLVNNKYPFTRRQDLPQAFMPNGAIYIININDFIQTQCLFTSKTTHFLMPLEKSIDIDSLEDIKELEKILKQKNELHR